MWPSTICSIRVRTPVVREDLAVSAPSPLRLRIGGCGNEIAGCVIPALLVRARMNRRGSHSSRCCGPHRPDGTHGVGGLTCRGESAASHSKSCGARRRRMAREACGRSSSARFCRASLPSACWSHNLGAGCVSGLSRDPAAKPISIRRPRCPGVVVPKRGRHSD